MRYVFIILSLILFNVSGCAMLKPVDPDAGADNADDEFDSPLALDLDASMIAWYESLARINFVAVIPSRSDIEVGDIFLTWDNKKAQSAEERLQRMMKRQQWEGSIVPGEIADQQRELDFADLPFVAVGSRESSDLIEIVPSNILSKDGTFRMRPTAGRIDSQPLHNILNWLQDDGSDDIGPVMLKKQYWRNLTAVATDGTQPVLLHVISEILYMQSLDIKLSGELDLDIPEDVEATIETDLAEDEDGDEDATTESVQEGDQTGQEQAAVLVDAAEDDEITITQNTNAFTRALAINEVLEAQGVDDNVGVKTKLVYIDEDDVVMRLTLPRPVAIGVRGLILQVDPLSGEVLRIAPLQP